MSIQHHPSEDTLLRYAGGLLAGGAPLVVTAHLDACETCRRDLRLLEDFGGLLLDELPATDLAPDALARVTARLDSPNGKQEEATPRPSPQAALLPPSLRGQEMGPRRILAPGIWTAPFLDERAGASTYLLRVGRGQRLPQHGHRGQEMTCVLHGGFSDEHGHYGAGDFVEVGSEAQHQPVADADGECICVISAEGPPQIRGLAGWLFRAFIRMP